MNHIKLYQEHHQSDYQDDITELNLTQLRNINKEYSPLNKKDIDLLNSFNIKDGVFDKQKLNMKNQIHGVSYNLQRDFKGFCQIKVWIDSDNIYFPVSEKLDDGIKIEKLIDEYYLISFSYNKKIIINDNYWGENFISKYYLIDQLEALRYFLANFNDYL